MAKLDFDYWDIDHAYYCYSEDVIRCESWDDFLADYIDMDMDLNLLFRFDVVKDEDELEEVPLEENERILRLFYVLQRKGCLLEINVRITVDDTPAVESYLAKCHDHMKNLWKPISE